MSVSSTENQVIYTGSGTGPYDFDFKIYETSDLLVQKFEIATEITTDLEETTDYVVTKDVDGTGHVDTVVSVSSSFKLIITRKLPLTQEITYVENDKFPAATHEEALDRCRMIDQQLQEQIDRTVKVPAGSALDPNNIFTAVTEAAGDAEASAALAQDAQLGAEAAQTAAETAQGLAEGARDAAITAKDDAVTAKNQAVSAQGSAESARDLANTYAAALKATSVTSNAIGTGSKTFTTQTGKQFISGQFVVVVDQADANNYMVGQVTSYVTSTLVVNVLTVGGSGTKTAWNIAIAGSVGPTGATGTAGLNFLSGAGVPSDSLGAQNDMYLNTTNWDVYKKGASTWGSSIGNIKGATGATGSTGATGPSGDGKFNTATTTVKTDNYTVQSSDFGNVLVMNNAGAKAFTLPNITTASVIILKNIGAGVCTITPDASDTCDVASLAQYENCILVADTTNNVWRNVTKAASGGASATELSFVNGDLSAGVLTVTHNKGLSAGYTALVTVVNNSGAVVIPDQINTFAANSFKVDLSSYGTLTGTWYVIYITK